MKKNIFAVFSGFVIILLLQTFRITAPFVLMGVALKYLRGAEYINAFSTFPLNLINLLLEMFNILIPIIGGFIVGKTVIKKGWLYGALLGVTIRIVSIVIVSITFILPQDMLYRSELSSTSMIDLATKNINSQIVTAPMLIALTSLGGFLADVSKKRKKSSLL